MKKSIYDPEEQNHSLDSKITIALEKISEAFRVHLWQESQKHGLSPIQIKLLLFVQSHELQHNKISYLASEFNLTKATVSDSVKSLIQKNLLEKIQDVSDSRSFALKTTKEGLKLAIQLNEFGNTVRNPVASLPSVDKLSLWRSLLDIISTLQENGAITLQRMCLTCNHYDFHSNHHHCKLLGKRLAAADVRIDCPEHERVPSSRSSG